MKKVIPNGITFLSLLVGTVALWQFIYGSISVGLILCLVCVACDGLDGYFARRFNACTRFGKAFDLCVDYCVFGLFLIPIPLRLFGGDIWVIGVITVFVLSHTARVIINLHGQHAQYHGMPDTLIPIVIAIAYFSVGGKIMILSHFALCAIYMHIWIRYPRYTDYRRMRTHEDMSAIWALLLLYVGAMLGCDWSALTKDGTQNCNNV